MAEQQLLAFAQQMLADETPEVRARAVLAIGSLDPDVCAALMQDDEAVRRAAVMQLVQQPQAGGILGGCAALVF
jgi:HEAT repeat protein